MFDTFYFCATMQVWFSNVPHARLVEDKGGQNWITIDKDKFKFPGGGTQFIHGADQYLNQIEEVIHRFLNFSNQFEKKLIFKILDVLFGICALDGP